MSSGTPGRVLITGAGGQVASALVERSPAGWDVIARSVEELDVTRPDQVREAMQRDRPALVIHTAAFTAVDDAESAADEAAVVNVAGTRHVAEAARDVDARLLYVSTDFVFDGKSGRPYAPHDAADPLSVYGRTKLAGEHEARRVLGERAVIVRTAWVYSRYGQNFVLTMLRLMREREEIGVVSDQIGTPTWATSLAEAVWTVAAMPRLGGVLHWTDAGVASWYDFAAAIQEEALAGGLLTRACRIRPLRSDEYHTRAQRPLYSVLDKTGTWAVLGRTPPHWRINLRCMLRELASR